MEKIIYPTDGSKTAKKALEFAAHIAKATNAKILVLSVVDVKLKGLPHVMESQMKQELKKQALRIANEAKNELKKEGLEAKSKTAVGNPSEEIVKLARKEKADLIVMGTHGITGLARVIIGSVADYVIREAHCPVVLVPAKR
jgi:nucleotide-binding universal stress UspA family protein